jgi:hypothetical protein
MSGEGFDNPITGSEGALVRDRIKSPNYVPLTTGWQLDRDGSADLGDATIRGSLVVNGPAGSYATVDTVAGSPALRLKPGAFADAGVEATSVEGLLTAAINEPGTATDDTSYLILKSPAVGAVHNPAMVYMQSATFDGLGIPQIIAFAQGGGDVAFYINGSLNVSGEITRAGGIDPGRGWVNGVDLDTSVVLAAAAPETTVMTLPAFTYRAGRVYTIEFSGLVTAGTAANIPTLRTRKTNPAGQRFTNGTVPCATTTPTTGDFRSKFKVGGSDVTATLVLTLQPGAAGNVTLFASATTTCTLDVYDIGSASGSRHAKATTLV